MATAKDYSKTVLTANRRFFYNARPAFSVCQRHLQEFQFLNNSDPGIVRRNARSWVYRNKQQQPPPEKAVWKNVRNRERKKNEREAGLDAQKQEKRLPGLNTTMNPSISIVTGLLDPFDALPRVGCNINHILEYCKLAAG
ncbi:hypothetical protein DM02DRAFT_635074 [Periconia macrospinosa]|uniref:Uncharacterized protein n=1 Tax=Periconia macrospinosa TaxID=97972 RepID=A0A2V1D436_9PLEO|nr:hypothetical protein DM02DRAFT_635074 [Periconia macrospinosa]